METHKKNNLMSYLVSYFLSYHTDVWVCVVSTVRSFCHSIYFVSKTLKNDS